MPGHFVIRTDENAFIIAAHDRFIHRAVEEDDRNIFGFSHIDNVLGGIVGAGIHHIDNQKLRAFGDGGGDLFGLGGLVAVSVIIVVGASLPSKQRVHGGTHARNVGVAERVIEYGNFAVARSAGIRAAAGGESAETDKGKNKRKKLS